MAEAYFKKLKENKIGKINVSPLNSRELALGKPVIEV